MASANPFPGMNPYLEDPALWGDLHHTLISTLRRQLNRLLPEGYVALIDERVYLETAETYQQYVPDITVGHKSSTPSSTSQRGVAVAEMPIHIQIDATPVREPFLQVFSVRNRTRQLVTIVEVLSPVNKTPSSEGRRLYLQKQRDLLRSNTHLIEIDLLHYGTHTAFPPLSVLRRVRPTWDYLVCLHRAGWAGAEADVWFIDLPEPLPTIAVPLLAPDPDVEVNLQAALNEAYEEGQYHRVIDYTTDCPASLPAETLEWVYTTLQTRGLRP